MFAASLGAHALEEHKNIEIKYGPYLTAMTETSVKVMWVTDAPAISWVETAPNDGTHFYSKERPKTFCAPLGRKLIGLIHEISLDGFNPGETVRYRAFSTEVFKEDNGFPFYGRTASTKVYKAEPLNFTLFNHEKESVRFFVVNDIHGDSKLLADFLTAPASANADFLMLNGDMLSYYTNENAIFDGFMKTAIAFAAGCKPILYARGNHETRGSFSEEFLKYFPTTTGKPYYAFRQGPVFFVVLDSGEDKPDNDIEYGGRSDFERYRREEAAWLERLIETPEFKSAPVKIVFSHIPMAYMDTDGNGWYGNKHLWELFLPILNKAKVNLILSGHEHRFNYYDGGRDGRNMPDIVNSNLEAMDIEATKEKISVRFYNAEGKAAREEIVIDIPQSAAPQTL